jgi:hypothetical protein
MAVLPTAALVLVVLVRAEVVAVKANSRRKAGESTTKRRPGAAARTARCKGDRAELLVAETGADRP